MFHNWVVLVAYLSVIEFPRVLVHPVLLLHELERALRLHDERGVRHVARHEKLLVLTALSQ